MKNILSLFMLMTAFSFQSFAQGPSDDDPLDPGGDIFTYQNGYSEGATEAANLKIALAPYYGGSVDFIEWHLYDENFYGNIGAVVDFNSPGIKVPVVKWNDLPLYDLMDDPEAFNALVRLEQAQYDSDFARGFYGGFSDHWYLPFIW